MCKYPVLFAFRLSNNISLEIEVNLETTSGRKPYLKPSLSTSINRVRSRNNKVLKTNLVTLLQSKRLQIFEYAIAVA